MTINILPPGGSSAPASPTQLANIRAGLSLYSIAEIVALLTGKAAASHSHTAAAISDFVEAVQDVVGALAVAAGGSYDDSAGTVVFPGGGGGGGGSSPDASASVKGLVQLAGALGGTAASPSALGYADAAALAAVLAQKAAKLNDTLTGVTLAGATFSAALAITPSNMGASTVIDTAKLDQKKVIDNTTSGTVTMTFSGTPAAGARFGALFVNSDTVSRTVAIPSSMSLMRQAAITSFVLPSNARCRVEWDFDGVATYTIEGDPLALSEKAIYRELPTGANDTIVLVAYAPHAGTITRVVSDSDSGTATYTVRINGTAIGAASNSVSSSQQIQTATTGTRAFAAGDRITLVRTSNSACVNGRVTVCYAPDAP